MSTKTVQIKNVKTILKIDKPVIVLELAGHPAVVRNPKQMLTDMQNSGRALGITSTSDPRFVSECFKLVGANITGDLKAFKAGDTYKVSEGHPDVLAGIAKIGDVKVAEKDGVWIEGFLSIPLTAQEMQRDAIADAVKGLYADMLGIYGTAAPTQTTNTDAFVPEEEDETPSETVTEAVGTNS